jgi:hypothetical protein
MRCGGATQSIARAAAPQKASRSVMLSVQACR